MSTATTVPQTQGELEGDEALETLRARRHAEARRRPDHALPGGRRLQPLAGAWVSGDADAAPRADRDRRPGAALDQETFTRVVTETVDDLAPGAAGEILTDALRHGSASARRESGETAVIAGFIAAMIAGATAMAQIERGANRLYGVERDSAG